jgi:P27 family predicted phage terminase small subunit
MKKGRKPKPLGLKVLQGTASTEEKRAYMARPPSEPPEPPDFLPVKAREMWDELAPGLHATGRLEPEHKLAMTNLVLAWYMVLSATMILEEEGLIDVDEAHAQRNRKHPVWQIWRDSQAACRAWATEFGLTPASQVRIKELRKARAGNPFDRFIVR